MRWPAASYAKLVTHPHGSDCAAMRPTAAYATVVAWPLASIEAQRRPNASPQHARVLPAYSNPNLSILRSVRF